MSVEQQRDVRKPYRSSHLDEIQRLGTRFERLEARMESLDKRIGGLDDRVAKLDNRTARFETRMTGRENRMSNIETVVADLNSQIKSWLGAAAKLQLERTRDMKANLADAKFRVGEIFHGMATDPESKSLREDVASFREQTLDWEVRLSAVEARLGIPNPAESP